MLAVGQCRPRSIVRAAQAGRQSTAILQPSSTVLSCTGTKSDHRHHATGAKKTWPARGQTCCRARSQTCRGRCCTRTQTCRDQSRSSSSRSACSRSSQTRWQAELGRLAAEALAPRPEQSARWSGQDEQQEEQDWAPRPERIHLHSRRCHSWLWLRSSRNGLRSQSRLVRLRAVAKACRRSLGLSRCLWLRSIRGLRSIHLGRLGGVANACWHGLGVR